MTQATAGRQSARRRGPLIPTIIAVVVVVALFVLFSHVFTDVLWFDQLGFGRVFWVQALTRGGLFVGVGLVMAAAVFVGLYLPYRNRPVYAPTTPAQDNLDRYRSSIEPLRRLLLIGAPIVFGLFAGTAGAARWDTLLLWLGRTSFGRKDAEFGMDIGFFVFSLPWLRFVVSFLLSAAVISGIAALITHYLYGGVRIARRQLETTRAARLQIGVTVAIVLVLVALNYWLSRYHEVTDASGLVTGVTYTDDNAVLPARAILAVAAAIIAVLFTVAAVVGKWRVPLIGTALLVISAIVLGGIYPWIVQRFQVRPSEQGLERPYIQRNIQATRAAYGLDRIEVTNYNARTNAERGALRQDAQTTASIRLMDPNLISDAFSQLQQNKQYYGFPDQLSVDRYQIDDKSQDTVIAARELNMRGLGDPQSWYNSHLVYTHGYGVVAAYGNRRASDGKPEFMQSGIPSTGVLGDYEPRIYFGESSPQYSIVGAPKGSAPVELDYPDDQSASGQKNTTFTGDGGPKIGNWLTRLMYAVKFSDEQIVLSDQVNSQSQILYNRDPRQRVEKVAPFLTLDGSAYPAVIDGRVQWILDGYTTSADYPYSTPRSLDEVTGDSTTRTAANAQALPSRQVNYIRNSVKATVDAYSGKVTLYAWDTKDPVLRAWEKIFPGEMQPVSKMSAGLMSHVRYPQDLFKVQRSLLTTYHVTDPDAFYSQQDFWSIPNDPTSDAQNTSAPQPPYYLTLQMPGQTDPSFSLSTSFIPRSSGDRSRNVLTGFLAADANAGDQAGKIGAGYGKLRLLQLPRDAVVPGPGQVQNNFNSDPTVSTQLNLLKQGGTRVEMGNLLTLPVGGGLLYVQPVYVRSSGETSYPLLQRVLVAFGDQIGFAPTLDEALNQIFGGDSGVTAGDAGQSGSAGGQPAGGGDAAVSAQAQLQGALRDAQQAMKDADAALKAGDFAKYGDAQSRLSDAVQRALDAEAAASGQASGQAQP